jgi:hypothetical protein
MIVVNSETAIWERLIEPDRGDLEPGAARFLLGLDFRPADRARMNELAAAVQQRDLDDEEQAELENYRHVSHLLALMQSKARRSLALHRADS